VCVSLGFPRGLINRFLFLFFFFPEHFQIEFIKEKIKSTKKKGKKDFFCTTINFLAYVLHANRTTTIKPKYPTHAIFLYFFIVLFFFHQNRTVSCTFVIELLHFRKIYKNVEIRLSLLYFCTFVFFNIYVVSFYIIAINNNR
jgi:hypothetical protein